MSFDIDRKDVADALRAEADAHGHTVEAELAALVERTYAPKAPTVEPDESDNWVRELIDLAKAINLEHGIEPFLPARTTESYEPIKL